MNELSSYISPILTHTRDLNVKDPNLGLVRYGVKREDILPRIIIIDEVPQRHF